MMTDNLSKLAIEQKAAVKKLGQQMGYGRIMHLAEELWREHLIDCGFNDGGALTVGPSLYTMVACPHPVKHDKGQCAVCCDSGRITKWVRDNLVE